MESRAMVLLGLVLQCTSAGACVRRYVEPDSLASAKVRFRLLNENEHGVVQAFKNEQCDGGRLLGLLMDVNRAGPGDRAELRKQGTREMIGSDVSAVRKGLEFEKSVKGPIVLAFKWHSYGLLAETWCPLTIAAEFRDGHQYEVGFDVN